MRRKVLLILIIFTLISMLIVIYAKANFRHVDNYFFYENSLYSFLASENDLIDDYEGMTYESMYDLKDFFIDDKVTSLENLENSSDYILIINTNQDSIFKGNGIINNCDIKKVIKGVDVLENQTIKIYDLVAFWRNHGALYLGGSTPLQKGKDYVVFLKKANNANLSNSYVFSSVKYGHVSVSEKGNILENYEQNSLKLKDISKYDFVFSSNSSLENISEYKLLYSKIWDKYKEL